VAMLSTHLSGLILMTRTVMKSLISSKSLLKNGKSLTIMITDALMMILLLKNALTNGLRTMRSQILGRSATLTRTERSTAKDTATRSSGVHAPTTQSTSGSRRVTDSGGRF